MSVIDEHTPPADSVQQDEATLRKKQRTESNEDSQEDCMTIRWDHSAICTCHGGVVHVKRLLKGRKRNPDGRNPALAPSNILSEPENPENGISFVNHQLTQSRWTGPQ